MDNPENQGLISHFVWNHEKVQFSYKHSLKSFLEFTFTFNDCSSNLETWNFVSLKVSAPLSGLWWIKINFIVEKSQKNATNVTLLPLRQVHWGHIWKHTVEKSQTNVTNVTLYPLMYPIWRHIWKHTMEKSRTTAISVFINLLVQTIWDHIWKYTVEKSHTNATNATMHPLRQASWGDIRKGTLEKQCD